MATEDYKAVIPHWWGYAPAEKTGPRSQTRNFEFSVNTLEQEFDLFRENADGALPFVQTIWFDNFTNPDPLILLVRQTNQRVVIPAFAQATRPVFAPDQSQFVVTTLGNFVGAADTKQVQLILLNVPVPIFTSIATYP